MGFWGIILIIIGVLGALIGVYFRESLRHAYEVKDIAIRLESHLDSMVSGILKSEHKIVLVIAEKWRQETLKALSSQGPLSFEETEKKYEKLLKEARDLFIKGNEESDQALLKDYSTYQ